jgi:hypothetical protein
MGYNALKINNGRYNVAIGFNALNINSSGSNNIAVGNQALESSTNSNNIAIGSDAGSSYKNTEQNNICIGSRGSQGEIGTLRIGDSAYHTKCYIPIRSIYNSNQAVSLNNSATVATPYTSLYYDIITKELVNYPIQDRIMLYGTDTNIFSKWNNEVRSKPLINNTIVIFNKMYTNTINTLVLPSSTYVNYGDKITIINDSYLPEQGDVKIYSNNIVKNNVNTTILTLEYNGIVELIFLNDRWIIVSGTNYT